MNDLLVVGRGPSVRDFDDWANYQDIMAISSSIFVVPEKARDRVQFAAQDDAKWYMAELHHQEATNAWQFDGHCRPWPFWRSPDIPKHVPANRNVHGGYRTVPDGVWDVIPVKYHAQFGKSMTYSQHNWGLQPNWGDFAGVVGHECVIDNGPNFTDGGPIGLSFVTPNGPLPYRNSFFFTAQVAHRVGYRRMAFVGVDLLTNMSELGVSRLRHLWECAEAGGHEWVNLSAKSALDFLPGHAHV